MDGLIIIYDAVNAMADTGEVPRETVWFMGALLLSFAAGFLAYLTLGRKLLIAMIVLTMALGFGYFVKLIPWWVPLMTLILTIVWSQTHKQVSEG
jgi:CHASE2 domain-containing sensor protein